MKNRYLLKLSGELFKGKKESGISLPDVDLFCTRLYEIVNKGIQLGIVVGGGNIFRGASTDISGYDRNLGDQIGMMATVLNALSLKERLFSRGLYARLLSGIKIEGIADLFNRDAVEETFSKGGIVIFCAGTGNPFFSTDTTAAIRALQIGADCMFKATKVDGIYDKDPVKFSDAKIYKTITYDQIIKDNLGIIDLTAALILKTNGMKLRVFNMIENKDLERACFGENVGSLVER